MKTIAKMTGVVVAMVLSQLTVNAQYQLSDPSYSTSNYKQPNKAEYAKRIEEMKPVVYLEEQKEATEFSEMNSLTSSANYKVSSPSKSKLKRFKVSTEPTECTTVYKAIPANYKMPHSTARKSKTKAAETIASN